MSSQRPTDLSVRVGLAVPSAFGIPIARWVSRIDWPNADSYIARILYESVSAADERRRLGEYAAPDRLAREIVDT